MGNNNEESNLRKAFKTTTAVVEDGKAVATTLSVEYGIKPLGVMEDPLMLTKSSNMKLRIAKAGGNGYSYNIDANELYELDEAAKYCFHEVMRARLHPDKLGEILCCAIKMTGKTAISLIREDSISKVRMTYCTLEKNIKNPSYAKFKEGNIKQQQAIKVAVALSYKDTMVGQITLEDYVTKNPIANVKQYADSCRSLALGEVKADQNTADMCFISYCCCDAMATGLIKASWFSKDPSEFGGGSIIKDAFKTPTQERSKVDNKVHGTGLKISFNLYESSPFRVELYEKVGDPASNGAVGLTNATMAPNKKPVAINLSCEDFLYMTGYMLDMLRERNMVNYSNVIEAIHDEMLCNQNKFKAQQPQTQSQAQMQHQAQVYTTPQSQVQMQPQTQVYTMPQSQVQMQPQAQVYTMPQSQVYPAAQAVGYGYN